MVEVVTLRSLTVQWKLSPFSWLWNPQRIPTNISTWTESCQNSYLLWRVVTCFVFSCDEMWILVLSDELRLHMVLNYILIYVRNWLRILGKWNVVIFNIASICLPNKEIIGIFFRIIHHPFLSIHIIRVRLSRKRGGNKKKGAKVDKFFCPLYIIKMMFYT